MPVLLTTWRAEIWRIKVQGQPGQIVCKIIRAKWIRGVAQAVEHLLCKHDTLSLNCSCNQKKKKVCSEREESLGAKLYNRLYPDI
jgi:hypothetical protein